MKYKFFLIGALSCVSLILSGCTINFGSSSAGPDGGVYKTTTRGQNWQQKALIPTSSGKPIVINGLDATLMVMDPSDPKALYYGTVDNGLYYSYDAGDSWFPVKSLGPITVTAFAVDPASKCTLYAAIDNRVMKSTDCSRTWQQVYFDNELEVKIFSIAIDHYDSRLVYIGTSRGEIIGSSDYGQSWQTLKRFDSDVTKIAIAPEDSRIMFVATKGKGLFRSDDRGRTWTSLDAALKDFPDSSRFRDLSFSKVNPGFMILATNYGLLKSINHGDDWTAIKLITPEKEATINAVVVSAADEKSIFYITDTTFYGTTDGGINWTTKKLPSSRAGVALVDDANTTGTMYLGVRRLKQ